MYFIILVKTVINTKDTPKSVCELKKNWQKRNHADVDSESHSSANVYVQFVYKKTI